MTDLLLQIRPLQHQASEPVLRLLALVEVAKDEDEQVLALTRHLRDGHLDRKRFAIGAKREQTIGRPYLPLSGLVYGLTAQQVTLQQLPERLQEEAIERLTHCPRGRATEDIFRARVK